MCPMIKCIIVDDEPLARNVLVNYAEQIDQLEVVASCGNALEAFEHIQRGNIQLVFLDIKMPKLSGLELIESIKNPPLVVFTTAYREFAIKAFDLDAIDYLLKPISEADLRAAINKYQRHFNNEIILPHIGNELLSGIKQMIHKTYKTRFMIRIGDRVKSVEVNEILYFFSLDKGCYLHTSDNRNYVIDFTLDALIELLDPVKFHRINRRYIISPGAIADMINLSGSKLKVLLTQSDDSDIYISRDRLSAFKEWLDR